jgi:hypothetical protein
MKTQILAFFCQRDRMATEKFITRILVTNSQLDFFTREFPSEINFFNNLDTISDPHWLIRQLIASSLSEDNRILKRFKIQLPIFWHTIAHHSLEAIY